MHCWYAWPTMERCSKPPDSWPRIMCGIGPREPAQQHACGFQGLNLRVPVAGPKSCVGLVPESLHSSM